VRGIVGNLHVATAYNDHDSRALLSAIPLSLTQGYKTDIRQLRAQLKDLEKQLYRLTLESTNTDKADQVRFVAVVTIVAVAVFIVICVIVVIVFA
jgi:cell division protein FtsX